MKNKRLHCLLTFFTVFSLWSPPFLLFVFFHLFVSVKYQKFQLGSTWTFKWRLSMFSFSRYLSSSSVFCTLPRCFLFKLSSTSLNSPLPLPCWLSLCPLHFYVLESFLCWFSSKTTVTDPFYCNIRTPPFYMIHYSKCSWSQFSQFSRSCSLLSEGVQYHL